MHNQDFKLKNPAKTIKNYYSKPPYNNKCFRVKCKENKVSLYDVSWDSYLILNMDQIQICNKKTGVKSVDCILIKHYYENFQYILFVELKKGKTKLSEIIKKFDDSFEEIYETFKEKIEVPGLMFLYIGRLNAVHERRKISNSFIKTHKGPKKIMIKSSSCSINDFLYKFS